MRSPERLYTYRTMVKQADKPAGKRVAKEVPPKKSAEEQIAVFNETFESFNQTLKQVNDSYARLQKRYQKLSDELTATNDKLLQALDQNIQTRSFLENILESLTSGVMTIDLDGRINSINKAGCEILQVSAESLIDQAYDKIYDGTLRRPCSLTDLLSNGPGYRHVEKLVQLAGGQQVPILVSSSCIHDHDGEVVGALEIFDDLTELRRMQEEMAQVKSLAALGEVAAVVAHEVRNPLNGIEGFASMLREELGEEHPKIGYVDKIIAGVGKLNRSVSSLLDYARDLKHDPQQEDLCSFLKETIDYFRMDLGARGISTRIELKTPATEVPCLFDRENLSGALINLFNNASEAMDHAGRITVLAETHSSGVAIDVIDEGKSVPDEIKGQIFTPFFTTREGGTGLGLALVRKVIDAHKGEIEVHDNKPRGSVFRVVLPQSAPRPQGREGQAGSR